MPMLLPIKREPRKEFEMSLDEIAREGARQMLVKAVEVSKEATSNFVPKTFNMNKIQWF